MEIPDSPQGSGVRNSSLLVIDETDDVIRVTHIALIEAGSCKWVDYVYPREEVAGKELKGREADGGGRRQREQDAELADRSILELSGGERQLVAMARALAQDPRVLLLDEPTAHLDLRHRVALFGLLREFVAEGRSALVVSHDLTLAGRQSDGVALLVAGRILASGPPSDVLIPQNLQDVFGIEADVLSDPDGAPVVLPRTATFGRSRS